MRILFIFFLSVLCARAEERILSYDSEIRVGRDGYLDVVETIRVNVEGAAIRRGIFRDFPQDYVTEWGLRQRRPFEVKGVMRNGRAEPFREEALGSGTRVWIGSPEVMLEVGSVQEYRIEYRTGSQLLFDENGDELYWNVTGNFWDFPIVEARARVVLPEGIAADEAEAYTGAAGAKGRAYVKTEEADGVSFRTTSQLASREGLTVVVRWAPGALDAAAYRKPGIWQGNMMLFLGLVLVVVGLIAFLALWAGVGIDPPQGVIVPGWEPPEGFSPAAVRYLKEMGFDDRCFTAAVLSLATKGYLKIEEQGVASYELTRRHDGKGATPDEEGLFDDLFAAGGSLALEQANHVRIGGAKANLSWALRKSVSGVHFNSNTWQWFLGMLFCSVGMAIMVLTSDQPMLAFWITVFLAMLGFWIGAAASVVLAERNSRLVGCLILLLPVVLAGGGLLILGKVAGLWCAAAMAAVMVASPVFRFLMKAPTRTGRKALDVIEGFREYLEVAEEDRLNIEHPPERTPELFERFLPYALALGVEQKWSEKFDGVLAAAGREQGDKTYQPTFYSGGRSGFENALTGAAIGAAVGGALASSSVAPSSSGSSGGGGGGGSSGGGGGGGGGGGW